MHSLIRSHSLIRYPYPWSPDEQQPGSPPWARPRRMSFMETFVDDMSLDEAQEAAAREQQLRGGLADAQKALADSGAKIDQMREQVRGEAVPCVGRPPSLPHRNNAPLPCPTVWYRRRGAPDDAPVSSLYDALMMRRARHLLATAPQ
eukprot:COSAG01_NODE_1585_length_9810_cov_8.980435_1_plen_147_part_00